MLNGYGLGCGMFNTTFNNISAISWWSVLLVEETEVAGEDKPKYPQKTTGLPLVTDKRYHIKFYRVHLALSGIRTGNFSGDMHCLYMPIPTGVVSSNRYQGEVCNIMW